MLPLILSLLSAARVFFQSRTDMAVEVLALRQQVAVLKRRRPRPPLRPLDRLFWTILRATWSRWKDALVIVQPETVVDWHRAGFRLYWRWMRIPMKWGTDSDASGAASEEAALVTAMIAEVPHLSQDFCE